MSKVYQLLPKFAIVKNAIWTIDFPMLASVNGFWFVEGTIVPEWDIDLVFGICPEGRDHSVDFMLGTNGWPLFSNRARNIIEKRIPNAIQFLPLRYSPPSRSFTNEFNIGQVLNVVDALERAENTVAYGQFVFPLRLKTSVVMKYPIFRVKDSCVQIFVRDDVKQIFEEELITGAKFCTDNPVLSTS